MSENVKPPLLLWKYRAWNQFAEDMIVHGDIHFSTVAQLNDPFEFRWHDRFPDDDEELDLLVRQMCRLTYPNDNVEERRVHYQSLLAQARHLKKKGAGLPQLKRILRWVYSVHRKSTTIS